MANDILTLHDAVARRDLRAAIRLTQPYCNVNTLNTQLDTPLMIAIHNKDTDMIELLVKCGAAINCAISQGQATPLHVAASIGHCGTVELLLQMGANVHAKTVNGKTPLMQAVWNGCLKVVQVLISYGADICAKDKEGYTAFHIAAQQNKVNILSYLLRCSNIDIIEQETVSHSTALHLAASNGCIDTCKHLLLHGANINKQNNYGNTALHNVIITSQCVKTVRGLLSFKPNLMIKNHDGLSTLDIARIKGLEEIDFYLIQHFYKHHLPHYGCVEDIIS